MRSLNLLADMQKVSRGDVVPTAWKNRLGTTQELLTWPPTNHWRVRLSVAAIEQSVDFSRFDGITRWFSVIDGDGLDLLIDHEQTSLGVTSDPLCFSGELPCAARLNSGMVHAFNVMFANGFEGRVSRVRSGESVALESAEFVGVYGVEPATCELGLDGVSLRANDLVWTADLTDSHRSVFVRDGHCLVVMGKSRSHEPVAVVI